MKKNKKKLIIIIPIISLIIIGIVLFFGFLNTDDNKLTLKENKWIDSNKHNVIDIALLSDAPILSYNGDGMVYTYLDYITKNYSLKFNVVPYKLAGTTEYDYKMMIVDKPKKNDIVLLNDNLVLVTNKNIQYKNIEEIQNLKLGAINTDIELLNSYFENKNIQFLGYENYDELKNALLNEQANLNNNISVQSLDGIIIPKVIITKEIIENNYKLSYNFDDLNKYFVITSSSDGELKSILNKGFNKWKESNYQNEYNKYLLSNYFEFKGISDVDQKTLKSKSYVYGFIDYGVYNSLDKNKLEGLIGLVLKDFNNFSGISITYTKYNSISKLLKDFNAKKVDFTLNLLSSDKYSNAVYNTIGVFNKKLAVISGIANTDVIDGIKSLKNKDVSVIKGTELSDYLSSKEIVTIGYNNLSDLAEDFSENDVAIVDLDNYVYYKTSVFKDTKINYLLDGGSKYNFVINDTNENKLFEELFNFYVSYVSINKLTTLNYQDIAYNNFNIEYLLVIIIIILLTYVILDFSNHVKAMIKTTKANKKIHLSKEEKIKYIDQLTSLKNRAYLNSRIESWDESDVYPQAIIIIDLNNISYINDNYGREEGDKVITEAANILIINQLQNSEIIRTDGNEFLIYLVGYNEKQVISYIRKLNRELKGLSHGFGAASGYSIINDAIKTLDDAVNEATIEMKNNKEDIEY